MHRIAPVSLLIPLCLFGATASAAAEGLDTEPIHHPSQVTELNKKTVRNIFLGKKRAWDDGQLLVIASLQEGTTHSKFLKEWVGMTPSQFRIHWRKRVFTGKGTMPTWCKTEIEQAEFVASTPGSIGYQRRSNKKSVNTGPRYFDPKTARYIQPNSRTKRRT